MSTCPVCGGWSIHDLQACWRCSGAVPTSAPASVEADPPSVAPLPRSPEGHAALLPCPFCGRPASMYHGMQDGWVVCTWAGCGAAGGRRSGDDHAADAWNRRAPPQADAKAIPSSASPPPPPEGITDAQVAAFKRAFHLHKERTYEDGLRVAIAAALSAAPEVIDASAMVADAMEGDLRRQIADLQATIKHERQQNAQAAEKHAAEYHRIATALGCHVHDDLAAKASAAIARAEAAEKALGTCRESFDTTRHRVLDALGLDHVKGWNHVPGAIGTIRGNLAASEAEVARMRSISEQAIQGGMMVAAGAELLKGEAEKARAELAAERAEKVHVQRVLATRNGELTYLRESCVDPHTQRCLLCNGVPVVLTSNPPQNRHHEETCPLHRNARSATSAPVAVLTERNLAVAPDAIDREKERRADKIVAALGLSAPVTFRDDNVCGVCGAPWGSRHSETCRNVPAAKASP